MPAIIKAALLMFVYALGLLVIGWVTMAVAPPGAKAITALIVPAVVAGLMIVCAVGTLMIGSNRALGMLGIHAGLILPLLFALAVGAGRMPAAFSAAAAFNEAVKESPSGVIVSKSQKENEPHPQGYQAVGMSSMATFSVLAFVALLMQRPKVPKQEPKQMPPPPPARPYKDDGE